VAQQLSDEKINQNQKIAGSIPSSQSNQKQTHTVIENFIAVTVVIPTNLP
jgi:hypothetical protein